MITSPASIAHKRILVVEDEPDIRRLIAVQMRLLNFEAIEAANGKVALGLVEEGNHFDMVITDAAMPELDGFELTKALRARPDWSDTPILMVTAYDDACCINKALKVGVNSFLAKPIDRRSFKAVVQNLLFEPAA